MNIFIFELRSHFKFIVIWAAAILIAGSVFLSFYPTIASEFNNYQTFFDNLPKALKNIPGMTIMEDSKFVIGYYATIPFTYISLIMATQALILGISILGREFKNKATDFLYTKPVSRMKIVVSKICAAVIILAITNLLVYFGLLLFIKIFLSSEFSYSEYGLLTISFFFLQLFFVSIGFAISSILKKHKSYIALSLGIVFTLLGASTFLDDKARLFSPFEYFRADKILANNSYDVFSLIIVVIVFSSSCLFSYYKINNKELN